MEGISVKTLRLPKNVKAVTVPLKDGRYQIFLNSFYGKKTQEEILKEEIGKIQNSNIEIECEKRMTAT